MIAINWTPSRRELRQFSVALLVFSLAVGALLWWKLGPNQISGGFWIGGPVLALLGLAVPPAIRPVFIGLTLLAFPIGYVVGFIALALIYYLLITPIGLLLRLSGRDSMQRSFDPDASSYWIAKPEAPPARRYFRQF